MLIEKIANRFYAKEICSGDSVMVSEALETLFQGRATSPDDDVLAGY